MILHFQRIRPNFIKEGNENYVWIRTLRGKAVSSGGKEMLGPPKQAQESLAAAMSLSGNITSWADCYKNSKH